AHAEHDRNSIRRSFGGECRFRAARGDDDGHPAINQVSRQLWQSIELILRPAIFNRNVSTIDIAGFAQGLTKHRHEMRARLESSGVEGPHPRQRWLLLARRQRPRSRAADKGDELAPL